MSEKLSVKLPIKSLSPHTLRLDVKAQKIDKGYPRRTDAVFGGVPNDAHDVFLYKGTENVASVFSKKKK